MPITSLMNNTILLETKKKNPGHRLRIRTKETQQDCNVRPEGTVNRHTRADVATPLGDRVNRKPSHGSPNGPYCSRLRLFPVSDVQADLARLVRALPNRFAAILRP